MCDNEFVAHVMVRERIREAEARGAFNALIRESERRGGEAARLGLSAAVRPQHRGWPSGWWPAAPAWLAYLTLPKTWNRL
jgi:hypothetical protein